MLLHIGLDAEEHFTTAYDLAILTNYALKNETFSNIVKNKTATITMDGYSRDINNTHELLGYTEGVYAVKTGLTCSAGRSLHTGCKRNNLDVIIVVLGADTKKIRTQDSLNLINYIYNNFEMIDTSEFLYSKFNIKNIKIQKSFKKASIYIENKKNYVYPISKNTKQFEVKIYFLNNQKAPLEKNSKVGVIKLFVNGNFLYENNILTKNKIEAISYKEYLYYTIKQINNFFTNSYIKIL